MVVPTVLAILIVWGATLALFFAVGELLIRCGLWPREWRYSTDYSTRSNNRLTKVGLITTPDYSAMTLIGADEVINVNGDVVPKVIVSANGNNLVTQIPTRKPQTISGSNWDRALPRGNLIQARI